MRVKGQTLVVYTHSRGSQLLCLLITSKRISETEMCAQSMLACQEVRTYQ